MSSIALSRAGGTVTCLILALTALSGPARADDNWERLGDAKLKQGSKEVTISVGIEEGWYRWIKLKADGGRVDLRKVRVVFSSGDSVKFDTFGVLGNGDETRPLPVSAALKRFIRRIEVKYEISGNADQIRLKAFGRRSD